MPSFDDFTSQLDGQIKDLVQKNWKDVTTQATKDATDFVKQSEEELKLWTQQLASGALTLADFELLLRARKDVATMVALKQAGLAKARVDDFLPAVIGVIVAVASKVFFSSPSSGGGHA